MIQQPGSSGFILIVISAMLSPTSWVWAQQSSPWQALPQGTQYDGQVPSPEQFFSGGFQVGNRHLAHHQLLEYVRAVDESSPRVTTEVYARSYGDRPLTIAIVTSPQNHSQLAEIAASHARWTDPSVERPASQPLAVIYLGYSVHGNEASGSNAAPLILYHLAAAQGAEMEQFLQRTIVIIDICLNPDGFDRFSNWVNHNRGQLVTADPVDREHHEVWPGGRTNYYWFDLNRDWLPAQHPETHGRLALFRKWMPNLVLDFHEMGTHSTFFFQPGVPRRKHPLIPASNVELTGRIGALHAADLDKLAALYFTEETFDDFYPGKGSTYADLHGGVGILFEQGSSRGVAQESTNGELSFEFTVRNQVVTSISSLKAVDELREVLLNTQRQFYEDAMTLNDSQPRAYLFSAPQDPMRIVAFAQLLERHGIVAYPPKDDIAASGLNFRRSESLVVPAVQPERLFLQALIERRTSFEDSVFYDVSAWCVPLAFDLVQADLAVNAAELADMSAKLTVPSTSCELQPDDVAAIIDWHGYYAAKVLYELLKEEIIVKVAMQGFSIDMAGNSVALEPGSLLVPLGLQPDKRATIQAILNRATQSDGIHVYTTKTGLTGDGVDLGSSKFITVDRPRVLLLVGRGVKPSEAGEIWHLMDQRFGIPITLVDLDDLNDADLSKYNVVTMVSGRYAGLGTSSREKLKAWIESGGTFVAIGTACEFVADQKWADIQVASKPAESSERRAYAVAQDDAAAKRITGAILQTNVDVTHPVAFGLRGTLPVMRDHTTYLQKPKDPYSTPLVYSSKPLLSGYVSPENLQAIADSPAVIARQMSKGRLIVIADDPNYRAFWYGSNRLFWNAIFFGPLVRGTTVTETDDHE